ncbi:MAG: hypothetical protein ABH983_02960 [Candidatus Micrarchaeota archaeon]
MKNSNPTIKQIINMISSTGNDVSLVWAKVIEDAICFRFGLNSLLGWLLLNSIILGVFFVDPNDPFGGYSGFGGMIFYVILTLQFIAQISMAYDARKTQTDLVKIRRMVGIDYIKSIFTLFAGIGTAITIKEMLPTGNYLCIILAPVYAISIALICILPVLFVYLINLPFQIAATYIGAYLYKKVGQTKRNEKI